MGLPPLPRFRPKDAQQELIAESALGSLYLGWKDIRKTGAGYKKVGTKIRQGFIKNYIAGGCSNIFC